MPEFNTLTQVIYFTLKIRESTQKEHKITTFNPMSNNFVSTVYN